MGKILSASRSKIARAQKHIQELQDEIAEYIASSPVSIKTEPFEMAGKHGFKFRTEFRGPPQHLSPIIGDIFHNLRSALDLAACECVRANGNSDANVYFPFCDDPDFLPDMIKKRNLHRASQSIVDYIASLRPYKGGNIGLRAIHDLNVRDKHAAIIPALVNIGGPIIEMWDDEGNHNPRIITDPNKPSELSVVFPHDTALANQQIVETLHGLVGLLSEILDTLAGMLKAEVR
jgi:hypothetical protein